MLSPAPSLLAVQGDAGIDLFRQIDNAEQARLRYLCVATQAEDGVLSVHEPAHAGTETERAAALELLSQTPALMQPFALADTRSHPDFADPALRFVLLLYQDFFRARAVACMSATLFARRLDDPPALVADPGAVVGAVRAINDMNLLAPTFALRDTLVTMLTTTPLPPGAPEHLAYALRMLGDLSFRGGEKALAMAAHDGAVQVADNPHRRRRAIEAAVHAGDIERAARHLRDFAGKWTLPADLAKLHLELAGPIESPQP